MWFIPPRDSNWIAGLPAGQRGIQPSRCEQPCCPAWTARASVIAVSFSSDWSASLFLEGLTRGQLYHVTGSVDGEEFFHFHDSEFTADASDLEVVQPVDVASRRKLLLKVMEGPIPPQ